MATTTETATQTLTISKLNRFLEDKLTPEDFKDMLYDLLTEAGWQTFEHCDIEEYWKIKRDGDVFLVAEWTDEDC